MICGFELPNCCRFVGSFDTCSTPLSECLSGLVAEVKTKSRNDVLSRYKYQTRLDISHRQFRYLAVID